MNDFYNYKPQSDPRSMTITDEFERYLRRLQSDEHKMVRLINGPCVERRYVESWGGPSVWKLDELECGISDDPDKDQIDWNWHQVNYNYANYGKAQWHDSFLRE